MDDILPKAASQSQEEKPPIKILLVFSVIILGFLLLIGFLLNYFGVYRLSDKFPNLSFLPTKEQRSEEGFNKYAPLIKKVDEIIEFIKTPDPGLVTKYDIPQERLKEEQIIIVCGGFLTGNMEPQEKDCTKESLVGIKKALEAENKEGALTIIKTVYKTVSNPLPNYTPTGGSDNSTTIMEPEEAARLDPDQIFLFYPPPGRGRPSFSSSVIKKGAALGLIQLYYEIKKY